MKKILIVDDIEGWRNYHSEILAKIFPDAKIILADSAKVGYDKLLENTDKPFDIIISDLQMEKDYEPKYAGEWFVEQVKTFKAYQKTKIVIISAAYNIHYIAEMLGVDCISKTTARNFPDSYDFLR